MASCTVCGKGGAKILCMGCGKMVCEGCTFEVRGVKYCNNCKSVAQEFQKSASHPTYTPDAGETEVRRKHAVYDTTADAKWEKHFDSSTMIEVSSSSIREIRGRIDLSSAYTATGARVVAHLLDIALCMILGFIIAFALLPNVENPLTMTLEESFEKDSLALKAISAAIVGFILLFIERLILNSFGGITLGRLFTGTKLVAVSGAPAGIFRGVLHAILSTVLDLMNLIGWILFLISSAMNKKGQALHDVIAGTCVVSSEQWKKACAAAILQRDKERAGVVPAQAAPQAGGAAVAAAGAATVAAKVPPKPLELPPEDEILSPFATYDEYEPAEDTGDETDREGEDTDRYNEDSDDNDDEHSTDIRDPYNY